MAIYRLLKNCTLGPKVISRLTAAYEQALHILCVKDRDDPLTEMITKTIIKIAQTGVHDFRRWRSRNWKSGKPS